MTDAIFWLLVSSSFILLISLLFWPVVSFFLGIGGRRRRDRIISTFTEEAVAAYFNVFAPGGRRRRTCKDLEELYDTRYGKRRYTFPCLLLFGVAGIALFWALYSAFGQLFGLSATRPVMPDLAIAALAGAYMWVVVELQDRRRASDLTWHQLTGGALRFAIAVPVAYAFTAGVQEGLGLPVAFLLGTFPTKTIFTTGRRLARNNLKLEDEAPRSADKIDVLQGINLKVAERFEEENITTIPQLAYCDVIDLTIRTGYEFSFVVDCASQALAYLYLEEQLPKLRIYGLRGAQEIGWFIDHVERSEGAEVHDEEKEVKVGEEDEDVQEIFGETPPEAVTRIAQALQLNPHGFWHALRQIAGDPYTKFLRDIWQTSTIGPAVHISALVPNPAGQDSGNKTVTIRNDGDDDVSLEGWYLRNARDKTCPLSGKVKGESEKVVRIKDSSFLDNAEDEISLLDPDGTVVDAFCYYGTSVVEGGAITLGH